MSLVYIHCLVTGEAEYKSSKPEEALESCSSRLKHLLEETLNPEDRGIYFASSNAGIIDSVEFWRQALEHSPRFANPARFPWTLASASASFLAKELNIKGPVYTLIGEADAILAALDHAILDLADSIVKEAVVLGVDFQEQCIFSCMILGVTSSHRVIYHSTSASMEKTDISASEYLTSVIRKIEVESPFSFGFEPEGAFDVMKTPA